MKLRLSPTIPMPGAIIATIRTATRPSDWLAALFGFALMVAYWPGIAGVATAPRWDVAALLAVALFFAPRVRMTASHWIGLALIGWLFVTLIWNGGGSDGRLDGIEAGFEIVIAAIAFAVGSTMRDIRALLIGAAVGIGINSALAIAQWFGWDGWHGIIQLREHNIAGLFYERGRLGGAAAMVAVGLVALPRLCLLLPLVAPALLLSGSRGAWLAAVVGLIAMTRYARVLLFTGAVLGIVGLTLVSGLGIHIDPSSAERLAIWRDTIANLTFFGHGLGSFREVFLQTASTYNINQWQSRPEHPHNEWLWLAFEGGVPAVSLAAVWSYAAFKDARNYHERGILACLAVLCLFAMPLHDPATLVLGAMVAGCLARRHALLRIVIGDCRDPLCPWLAAVDAGRFA